MSQDPNDLGSFFAPPAFKPAEALVDLRRRLRELRALDERSAGNTGAVVLNLKGQPVIELTAGPDAIEARLARRPARSPEWQARSIRSSAQLRDFAEEVRRRLAQWDDETG